MAEHAPKESKPTSLGIYDTPRNSSITLTEIVAAVLAIGWLVGSITFFALLPPDETIADPEPLRGVVIMLAIFLPVAMIWIGAIAARSSRVMREESARLQTAIDAIRKAYVSQSQTRALEGDGTVARKLDEIAAATRKTETALATFATARPTPTGRIRQTPTAQQKTDDQQASLALGTDVSEMAPPLETADFIRALNFPETAEDEEGFTALRKALQDRRASTLIRAAQDVLTLLSQDGIYMDDLRPDRARPEIWRKFAQGERGRSVAALGGIRDRSSLALTAGRMKEDPIFRDAAHHFLRHFDKTMTEFEPQASDTEISALSDTRTARALRLVGRVAGTFD